MSLSVPNKRPGPLREWPLDRFLPSNPNIKASSSRPNKRTLSPDGPSLLSPTKRRILNEEGFFVPEKTVKSPLRGRIATPARFGDLLGPDSPAKRLDFGAPKALMDASIHQESTTPCTASSSASLSQSPELRSRPVVKSTPPRGADLVVDDFFATPEHLPSSSRSSATMRYIPRDSPASSDPQSIHYPGFTVHQDAHIVVMDLVDSEMLVTEGKEESKENLVPRKKMKKPVTEPASPDAKLSLLTPEAKKRELEKLFKAKPTPATPKKVTSKEWQDVTSPTPRRPGLRSKVGTPVITEEERKQRRLIMKNEVEAAGGASSDEHL